MMPRGMGRDASDGANIRGGKPWLPAMTFMTLSMLVGVGFARIIFVREFADGTADIAGAFIGFMAMSGWLATREHRSGSWYKMQRRSIV